MGALAGGGAVGGRGRAAVNNALGARQAVAQAGRRIAARGSVIGFYFGVRGGK